ncbi:glutamyl-tRNA(Gln) amidotransferase subunit C, mitochondrial [Halyomorpha halys]|uniref:glutamyl-tRNA(Gln) amidotransferase subunit C, mitochondrial n=1 Tax=Halyomorpha halys TaxID=286706 RepID=UPI0006D4E28D|nr:glutamyl-tRNA(Gln) amidotransferase subunit C, mitochondrial [Halyomorpha halys]
MLSLTVLPLKKCLYQFSINCLIQRSFCSKVPKKPFGAIDLSKLPPPTKIDKETIEHLERISLVDFGDEKGIQIVEEAVRFADQLFLCNTEGVEPLTTLLEDRALSLRNDEVVDGNCKNDILLNAKIVEEDYFVAPRGNVPLEPNQYNLELNDKKVKNEQSN